MKKLRLSLNVMLYFFFLIGAIPTYGQWQSDLKDRTIKEVNLNGFTAISVSNSIDVYLSQADDFNVQVRARNSDLDKVVLYVKGEELVIKIKDRVKRVKQVEVAISLPVLKAIYSSGDSDVEGRTDFLVKDLQISSSGGSDVELKVQGSNLSINTSGDSDVEVKGTCEMLNVKSSGGSDVEAKMLMVKHAIIRASGGSEVEVNVSENLEAIVSGDSEIGYIGQPKKLSKSTSGAAEISAF